MHRDNQKHKGFGIKAANSQIAILEGGIDKQKGDAEASSPKVEELAGSIETEEKDLAVATIIH